MLPCTGDKAILEAGNDMFSVSIEDFEAQGITLTAATDSGISMRARKTFWAVMRNRYWKSKPLLADCRQLESAHR